MILWVPLFIANAFTSDGTIDPTYKYAWSENTGWINFGTSNGNVHVTDSGLSGYALGENIGWIYLGDIVNDGNGNLSGMAWSENTGWIKFNPTNGGVIINSSGEFTGSALSENIGWIIFDGDKTAKTDWRPASNRFVIVNGSGPLIAYVPPILPPPTPPTPILPPTIIATVATVANNVSEIVNSVSNSVLNFFKPKEKPVETNTIVQIPKIAPPSFNPQWNFLPVKAIKSFVFAPLPKAISNLVQKFPELGKTFKEVGINKISDLQKLKNTKFTLSGINSKVGLSGGVMVPISSLTKMQKALVPSEVIFAKAGDLIAVCN